MNPLRLLLATTLLLIGVANAADVPKLQRRVNDYAGVLQRNTRTDLEARLARYERETTHQIAVLTVPSLGGEPIEAFSLRVANAWALGRRGVDNGVLVTIAPTEHQVRIELGKGMGRRSDASVLSPGSVRHRSHERNPKAVRGVPCFQGTSSKPGPGR